MISSLAVGILFVNADVTIQSKIDSATEKTTIQLDTNYTENITIGEGKDIILDLNGKTLSGKISVNGGNLVIDDTATGGKVNLGNNNISVENGTFTLENGTIESTNNYGVYGLKGSTITINGGAIKTGDYACLGSNNTTGNATFVVNGGTLTANWQTIYLANPVGLTINGGTLNGGIAARMGIININGGTINATVANENEYDKMKDYYTNNNGYIWTADAIHAMAGTYTTDSSEGNKLEINIKGGTINALNGLGSGVAIYDIGKVDQNISVNISGGTFNYDSDSRSALDILSLEDIGVTSPKPGYGEYSGNAKAAITGGTYKGLPDNYIAEGYAGFSMDGETFKVLPAIDLDVNDEAIYIPVDKTSEFVLDIGSEYNEFIYLEMSDNSIASYSNGIITAKKVGYTEFNVGLGGLGTSIPVFVYDVKAADGEGNNAVANNVVEDLVAKILDGEKVEGLSEETIGNIIDAVAHGMPIETEVKINEVNKNTIASDVLAKIEKAVAKNNGVIAAFLNIDVLLKESDNDLGNITKLPNEIELSVDIDKKFTEIPDGVNRTFFVVRLHEGEEPTIIPATLKNGKLVFKTDRFSSYILAYKDTEETKEDKSATPAPTTGETPKASSNNKPNPKTGDIIINYIAIAATSGIGIACLRKKKHN